MWVCQGLRKVGWGHVPLVAMEALGCDSQSKQHHQVVFACVCVMCVVCVYVVSACVVCVCVCSVRV